MRYFYLLLLTFFCMPTIYAQKEHNVWYMGVPQALDFNTSPPRLIPMQANVQNGGAAVCDSNGKLLFYTNGRVVLDSDHNIMPGSIQLDAASTFMLGVSNDFMTHKEDAPLHIRNMNPYIVQYNKAQPLYYLFYNINQYKRFYPLGTYDTAHIAYAVVDMRLRNGKGDVVTNKKNVSIDSINLLKQNSIWINNTGLTAVDGRCNTWLVYTKVLNENNPNTRMHEFHIKSIDENGIIADHSINTFPSHRNSWTWISTEMKTNRRQNMFLENAFFSENWQSHTRGGLRYRPSIVLESGEKLFTYDFDKNVGHISNFRYRGISEIAYFSPWGSKILSMTYQKDSFWNDIVLTRFDTTHLGDSLAIAQNTKTLDISDFPEFVDAAYTYRYLCADFRMHTGPDDDLYMLLNISYFNAYPDVHNKTFILRVKDADSDWDKSKITVLAKLDKEAILANYQIPINEEPLRGAKLTQRFGVQRPWFWAYLGQDAVIHNSKAYVDTVAMVPLCNGSVYIKAPYPDFPFTWWNGSTADSVEVTAPGAYRVTTSLPNCSFSQDIMVVAPSVQLPPDTTICAQIPMQLLGVLNLAQSPQWNTGENTLSKTITETGRYILRAESVCGRVADTINITVRDCTCNPFVPNAFTPNNDGLNDVFKPIMQCTYSDFELQVFNRFGNMVFQSRSTDDAWDGTYKGKPADFGVYFWQLRFKNELGETMNFKGDLTLLR